MPIKTEKPITGKALRPNIGIAVNFSKPTLYFLELMYNETKRELEKVFKETNFTSAMDASTTSQAKILLNWLLRKWQKRFDEIAKTSVNRMIERTLRNSAVTLNLSLKDASENLKIDTSFSNSQLKEVIKASTQEAANLIKVIPQRFLNDVQGQVMRSITTGKGMEDLVPYLTKMYKGNVKRARNTALDQTRKAYQSINTTRLKSLGVKSFIWIHSGGGKVPRPKHVEMSGNEYKFNNPPIIGTMYGSEVYGLPGDLPNCRCICKPVINFDLED